VLQIAGFAELQSITDGGQQMRSRPTRRSYESPVLQTGDRNQGVHTGAAAAQQARAARLRGSRE